MRTALLNAVFATLLLSACKHNPYIPDGTDTGNPNDTVNTSQPCSQDTVYFANQIQPILVSNCAKPGCHDANTRTEGYNFSDYNDFINTDAVRGGNLGNSEMWEVINETDPDKLMPPPPNTPLTQDQKNLIRTWILQGGRNNGCTENTCDTSNVSLSTHIRPIIQSTCIGCHSTAAANTSGGGINLENYNGLQIVANNGKLVCAVNHGNGCVAMPLGSTNTIPQCQIDQIEAWVNAGAPNN